MAKLVKYNEVYEFDTEAEQRASCLLTEGNIQAIKNQLYFETQRRLNIIADPNNVLQFIQEEAEIKGAINAYIWLLNQHRDLIEMLGKEVSPS